MTPDSTVQLVPSFEPNSCVQLFPYTVLYWNDVTIMLPGSVICTHSPAADVPFVAVVTNPFKFSPWQVVVFDAQNMLLYRVPLPPANAPAHVLLNGAYPVLEHDTLRYDGGGGEGGGGGETME